MVLLIMPKKYNYTKKTGRPAKYTNPDDMTVKIEGYFDNCPDTRSIYFEGQEHKVPCLTITGLALHLGFCDKRSMYDYAVKQEFSHPIKSAISRIERMYESMLHGTSPTGAIFALKNFGWRDKHEEDTGVVINQVINVVYSNGKPNDNKDTSPGISVQRFNTPMAIGSPA